jgi:hypothetical protein
MARKAFKTGIYAHIVGWGMSVPENVMTNDDISAIVETDNEWIVSRTGIRERRIANDRESTATLAYKAAQSEAMRELLIWRQPVQALSMRSIWQPIPLNQAASKPQLSLDQKP